MTPRLLSSHTVEKVWGRDVLPAPFVAPEGKRIGELWFDAPPELDSLLGKYLFTSEKLSVQVHPSGKDECWLVLDCDPGAVLAAGFVQDFEPEAVREGALDGSIEDMLAWHEVSPGDFLYIPHGTVHAIGAGCTLLEMQQNLDMTYRFYDYGRPRELHLDDAMSVANCGPLDPDLLIRSLQGSRCLVDGPFFRLDRVEGPPAGEVQDAHSTECLVLPIEGEVEIDGVSVKSGECALAHGLGGFSAGGNSVTLVCSPRG